MTCTFSGPPSHLEINYAFFASLAAAAFLPVAATRHRYATLRGWKLARRGDWIGLIRRGRCCVPQIIQFQHSTSADTLAETEDPNYAQKTDPLKEASVPISSLAQTVFCMMNGHFPPFARRS